MMKSEPTREEILAALESMRIQPPPPHMMTLQEIANATGRARSTVQMMARARGLSPQTFRGSFKPEPHYDVRALLPQKSL